MAVLVQKYGGSSLSTVDKLRSVARRVADSHRRWRRLVVVVSARGDTTDELLRLSEEVAGGAVGSFAAREVDQLLATGECAAAAQLAITLARLGVPAVSLTGPQAGIRVTGRHGGAMIDRIDTGRMAELLEAGRVAVVGGFHGADRAGDVRTLGRGGSDTTAVAVAAAMGADRCEVFTDVDGVRSADPRVVPRTRQLPRITPEAMAEMSFAGAGVLHSRAVELAAMTGVELRVRSATGPGAGTVVSRRGGVGLLETSGAVVAVSHDLDVARVLVHCRGRADLAAEILEILAHNAVPVDLVARSGPQEDEFRMGFTIRRSDVADVRAALEKSAGSRGGDVRVDDGVGKVSLIGMGLLNRPAYVARMIAVLAAAGIATSWVSTSQLRASATVPRERVCEAVTLLHEEFGLGPAGGEAVDRDAVYRTAVDRDAAARDIAV
ncbi:aspartate kinase [Actinophytocola xanthii]|nr:aspartate kinase [Actinophytocola xanthii]